MTLLSPALCSVWIIAAPLAAATCDSLAALKLADTTIISAKTNAAGAFAMPASAPPSHITPTSFKRLPDFCRVEGVIQPSNDSHIEFEVWLPSSGWNGNILGVGNGGFAGSINYSGLADSVLSGYASSSADTGHEAGDVDGQWALGHPEKIVDYGYRAIHETAEKSKSIVDAFYGESAKHSYFSGCSNGGRQALMEAQRYPADYDGLIAGAPSAFLTHLEALVIWLLQATEVDPASYIPANKYPAIEAAALAACDARDGVKDGVIDDPTKCNFKPAALLCRGPESDSCLTGPQITALEKIYAGPRNPQGAQVHPGFLPGGESGPGGWTNISGPGPRKSLQYALHIGAGDIIHQNAAWNFRTFDFDHDVKAADDTTGRWLNAVNPNLRALRARGGKLILYHGWSDPLITPLGTVNYYRSVVAKMGMKQTSDFVRLYMVPGMQHCRSGPGPDSFGATPGARQADSEHSMTAALERWVETGTAPGTIIAAKYEADRIVRTRPLCPYPQVARYSGTGSTDDAANFTCVDAK
jgi:feruloyl esterase